MPNVYYEMLDKMEKSGVDVEYLNGWAAGFLRNPGRGPQYLNEAYEAGYQDGLEGRTDGYGAWQKAAATG